MNDDCSNLCSSYSQPAYATHCSPLSCNPYASLIEFTQKLTKTIDEKIDLDSIGCCVRKMTFLILTYHYRAKKNCWLQKIIAI